MHESPDTNQRRFHRITCALAAGVGWTLTACATAPGDLAAPAPRPLGRDIPAYVAQRVAEPTGPSDADPDWESTADPAPEPHGRLRMIDALTAALLRHPDLAAAAWETRAAEARLLQAGLHPNPELDLEVGEFGGTDARRGFRSSEISVGLSQEILLAGKRGMRAAVARLDGDLAGWDYEAARLDVITETAQAFIDVLAAQERLALIGESVRNGEEVLRTVGEQARVGKVPPLDEKRAAVALALHRLQRDRVARELATARRKLAASWGGTSPLFDDVEGAFFVVRAVPTPDALASLLTQNPDLARWSVEMERHRAGVALRRAERTPDVTVTAGVSHFREDGGEAFLLGLAIPLPVFDQNLAGIMEARAGQHRARQEMRSAAIRVRTALFEAYEALAVSSQEARTLRDAVLPTAQAAFEAADEGFRRGKFGYLDVLDAQRTLFEVREQLLDALASYHAAVADVERLIGQSLDSIEPTGASDRSDASHRQGDTQ